MHGECGLTAILPHLLQIKEGLRAVDWDFELENVDGAMFDLHTIQFQPMALSRRTRG